MNTFKLILTATFTLTFNLHATDALTPSEKYTMINNSSYLMVLEKKRNAATQERQEREQIRQYVALKQQLEK